METFASRKWLLAPALLLVCSVVLASFRGTPGGESKESPADGVRSDSIVRKHYAMDPPHHSKDPAVKIDYDIVYVRAPEDAAGRADRP